MEVKVVHKNRFGPNECEIRQFSCYCYFFKITTPLLQQCKVNLYKKQTIRFLYIETHVNKTTIN